MGAYDIRLATLRDLRATRTAMLSATWVFKIEKSDAAAQKEAAAALFRVQLTIRKLEDAQLADIRDRLLENERDLEKRRAELATALQNLAKVKNLLTKVGAVLTVIGKVVDII